MMTGFPSHGSSRRVSGSEAHRVSAKVETEGEVSEATQERSGATPAVGRQAYLMLALATLGFTLNFWAWALISPLGPLFRDQGTLGALSESDVALMVAVPVLVGSLGRIVVGGLTDLHG